MNPLSAPIIFDQRLPENFWGCNECVTAIDVEIKATIDFISQQAIYICKYIAKVILRDDLFSMFGNTNLLCIEVLCLQEPIT